MCNIIMAGELAVLAAAFVIETIGLIMGIIITYLIWPMLPQWDITYKLFISAGIIGILMTIYNTLFIMFNKQNTNNSDYSNQDIPYESI